ncbi:MAG: archaellin/type IV pilin N-terminal domain-containing protein [Nitrososphaerales archaeon]
MNIEKHGKRKAISPILATVILIAITLVAAVAIAGFVFGLFGTFTSSANLQLVSTSCKSGAAAAAFCSLYISNSGGSTGTVTGCFIYGVAGFANTIAAAPATATLAQPITGGTASPGTGVSCTAVGAITSGAVVTGSLTVSSGSPLAFSAIAS